MPPPLQCKLRAHHYLNLHVPYTPAKKCLSDNCFDDYNPFTLPWSSGPRFIPEPTPPWFLSQLQNNFRFLARHLHPDKIPPSLRDNATKAFALLRKGRAHLGGEGRQRGNSDEKESISPRGYTILTVAQQNAQKKAKFDYFCEKSYWPGSYPREMSFKDYVMNRVDREWSVCEELLGEREWSVWRDKVISQFYLMGGRTANENKWLGRLGLPGWGWEYRFSDRDNATTTTEDLQQMKNEWFGRGGTLQRVSVWDRCDEMSFLITANKKDPKTGKIHGLIERSVVDEGRQWLNETVKWKMQLIGENIYDMRYLYLFRGVVLMVFGWWLWKKLRAGGGWRRNQRSSEEVVVVVEKKMVELNRGGDGQNRRNTYTRDESDAPSPYRRRLIDESDYSDSEDTGSKDTTNSEETETDMSEDDDTPRLADLRWRNETDYE